MREHFGTLCVALAGLLALSHAQAGELCVKNADASLLCLKQPAQRVISLAPHLSEMMFAVDAGEQLVGVVSHSDYPPAAKALPDIGSYHQPDLEKLLALQPDLVLGWQSGTSPALRDKLTQLGLKLWVGRGEQLSDIAAELRAIGALTGHAHTGEQAAQRFEHELESLAAAHRDARPLRGFYQVWPQPLVTVSDGHFISEAMRICAVSNIVGQAQSSAPTWSVEAVVRARPEIIFTSAPARDFENWQRWSDMPAVKNHALIVLPADVLMRPAPRVIEGVRALCTAADRHRQAASSAAE